MRERADREQEDSKPFTDSKTFTLPFSPAGFISGLKASLGGWWWRN